MGGGRFVVGGDEDLHLLAGQTRVQAEYLVEVLDAVGGDGVRLVDVAVEDGGEMVLVGLLAVGEPALKSLRVETLSAMAVGVLVGYVIVGYLGEVFFFGYRGEAGLDV